MPTIDHQFTFALCYPALPTHEGQFTINLQTCMSLGCWRKQGYANEPHVVTGRTCKLHIQHPRSRSTMVLWGSGSSWATVLPKVAGCRKTVQDCLIIICTETNNDILEPLLIVHYTRGYSRMEVNRSRELVGFCTHYFLKKNLLVVVNHIGSELK